MDEFGFAELTVSTTPFPDSISTTKVCLSCSKPTVNLLIQDLDKDLISVEICCKVVISRINIDEKVVECDELEENTSTVLNDLQPNTDTLDLKPNTSTVMDELDWEDDDDLVSFAGISLNPVIVEFKSTVKPKPIITTINSATTCIIPGSKVYAITWYESTLKKPKAPIFKHENELLSAYLSHNPADLNVKSGDEEYESNPSKLFLRFQKTLLNNPDAVVRYGSEPLWVSRRVDVACRSCTFTCEFLFQVLPVLFGLYEMDLDWSSLYVFRCKTCRFLDVIIQSE